MLQRFLATYFWIVGVMAVIFFFGSAIDNAWVMSAALPVAIVGVLLVRRLIRPPFPDGPDDES